MSKSPAFQTYAADYYIDTAGWDPYAVGIYQRLLLYGWVNGGLPNDQGELVRISGSSRKKFDYFWNQNVCSKFKLSEDGKWRNKRQEEVRENQLNYSESRRKNVSTRYPEKPTYVDTHVEHMNLSSSSSSSSSLKNKEKKEEKDRSAKPSRSLPAGEDFISSIRKNPAYSHVDIENELNKMDAWLSLPKNKGRKKTPGFVLKWFNRIEKPIDGGNNGKPPTDPIAIKLWEIEQRKKQREAGSRNDSEGPAAASENP